jgi:O-antigen/teichoic acid export membrane protein
MTRGDFNRKAILSLISSYASQFATTAAGLVSKLVLARLIAPKDLGLYALALLVLLGCDLLVDLGVFQHLIREKDRPYGNVLLMRLSISAVLIAIIEMFAGRMRFWGADLPPVLRVLAMVIAIKAASGVPNVYLDRELLIHKSLLPQMWKLFMTAIVSIGLACLHYGVWALVYGTIAGELFFAVAIWKSAWGHIPIEVTWVHTRELIFGSKLLFLIAVMGFVLQQGDIAIIGTLLDSKQVGYYTMALTIIVMVSKVVETAIYRVIYPMFCEFKEDIVQLGKIYRHATLAITAVEAPIYFYLLFNSPVIVSLILGRKWMPAAHIMQVLSLTGIINPFSTFGSEVMRAKKRDRTLTASTVIGATSLLVFGYLLTSRFGTVGMAMADYIIVGSIPVIVGVYRILTTDFRLLLRQLAVVYILSFAGMAAVSLIARHSSNMGAMVGGLLIPVSWYTYYILFWRSYGARGMRQLRSAYSTSTEEVELQGDAAA